MVTAATITEMPQKAGRSPWGKIQTVKTISHGIWFVSTASHGGIKLSRKRQAEMPEEFRAKGAWYEEDCQYSLVILGFSEIFRENEVEIARRTAKNYYPDEYEQWSGQSVPVEESKIKKDRVFLEQTKDKFVVSAAWADWQAGVPTGMVGVLAHKTSTKEEKWFLVPSEEYAQRKGCFVIQPNHQEVSKFI
jgi:hypothetical protein